MLSYFLPSGGVGDGVRSQPSPKLPLLPFPHGSDSLSPTALFFPILERLVGFVLVAQVEQNSFTLSPLAFPALNLPIQQTEGMPLKHQSRLKEGGEGSGAFMFLPA